MAEDTVDILIDKLVDHKQRVRLLELELSISKLNCDYFRIQLKKQKESSPDFWPPVSEEVGDG